MDCLDDNVVSDLVEGRVPPGARAELTAHLDTCSACRVLVAEVSRVMSAGEDEAPAEPGAVLVPGTVLGRYVILETVGAGAMGIVYAAQDPELERRVALKLLRPGPSSSNAQVRARLLREAQALARLSHPNVVTVLDVGNFGEQVFLTMELVEGVTLAEWLRAGRSPAEVIQAFRQAGAGLAAAHEVGLVHRDFKPENVLVGNDGRVRVTDFGLARGAGEVASTSGGSEPCPARARGDLSRSGTVVGTPAYMAPEQRHGAAADARSDQYAFAVAFLEALTGRRPSTAGSPPAAELARSSKEVPRWLRPVLATALAEDPEQRYPHLDRMLAALAESPPLTPPRAIAAALALIAAVAVVSWVNGARPSCDGAGSAWGTLWASEDVAAARAAFLASRHPGAEQVFARVARALEEYRGSWVEAHSENCRATRVRGEQSEALLDLRMACLDDRREQVAALVHVFRGAGDGVVASAESAVARLATVATCANTHALAESAPIPADPRERAKIDELARRVAELSALEKTGQLEALAAGLASTSTRGISYPPLEAKLLWLRAASHRHAEQLGAAAEELHRAAGLAIQAREDGIAADAWMELITLSAATGDLEGARRWATYARSAISRLGGDPQRGAAITAYLRCAEAGPGISRRCPRGQVEAPPSAREDVAPPQLTPPSKTGLVSPFAGTWTGTLTDGRTGYPAYSRFTLVITERGSDELQISWSVPFHGSGLYVGTWSGTKLSAANGRVSAELLPDGSMRLTEADAAQAATLRRAP